MAAVDYFLKITDIPGESMDSKHKDEIDVESWSWGQTNGGSNAYGGGGGAGKAVFADFNFSMKTNKATPALFLACANGTHIKELLLTCRKAGKDQQEYYKIKLTDAIISSSQLGGSPSDVVPTHQVAINFSKIEHTYAPQKADGKLDSPIVKFFNIKEMTGG